MLIVGLTAGVNSQEFPNLAAELSPSLSQEVSQGDGQHTAKFLSQVISRITPHDQPVGQGDSKDTQGAGTRGPCDLAGGDIVALFPFTSDKKIGLKDLNVEYKQKTASATPNLYFFSSESDPISAQFFLFDETGQTKLLTLPIHISSNADSFTISLAGKHKLLPGIIYLWKLALYQTGEQANGKDDFEVLQGSIQHYGHGYNLKSELENAPLLDQSKIYAQNGYWSEAFEAVTRIEPHQQAESLDALLTKLNLMKLNLFQQNLVKCIPIKN